MLTSLQALIEIRDERAFSPVEAQAAARLTAELFAALEQAQFVKHPLGQSPTAYQPRDVDELMTPAGRGA